MNLTYDEIQTLKEKLAETENSLAALTLANATLILHIQKREPGGPDFVTRLHDLCTENNKLEEEIKELKDKLVVAEEALKDCTELSYRDYLNDVDQDDVWHVAEKAIATIRGEDKE